MTLTLEVPPPAKNEDQRQKRVKAAVSMYDAQIVSEGQAAEIAGLSLFEFVEILRHLHLRQLNTFFSPQRAEEAVAGAEHLAPREARIRRFEQWAESNARDIPLLSDEAISRETIYGAKEYGAGE